MYTDVTSQQQHMSLGCRSVCLSVCIDAALSRTINVNHLHSGEMFYGLSDVGCLQIVVVLEGIYWRKCAFVFIQW